MEPAKVQDELDKEWSLAELELRTAWNVMEPVDEMSLLFHSDAQLQDWCGKLNELGWEEFNFTTDTMHYVAPLREHMDTKFEVAFTFLQHPIKPYRIEAMEVVGGTAPLHQHALSVSNGHPVIIHASFKVPLDMNAATHPVHDHYDQFLARMRKPPAASYRNSYGRFSYYGWKPVFIKPRVNDRDRAQSSAGGVQ